MDRGAEWQEGRDGPVLEEVKFATILFADIVRSTELVAALSPDDAFQTLEPALSVLIQAVEEVGGTVNRVTGDGVMAMFGAPRADEDHALTACIAALTMIARTELLARAVSLRVGVHSGEFVVHPLQVSSARLLDAAGLAVHMAARIQQAAKPGEVWISAETRRLCGGRVQVDRNARVALRGIPGKLPLARLRGVDAAAGRLDATGRRALSPFIGRRTELRQLTAAWSGAQRGTGNAVLVTGEAGLGKSRFVAEFLRRRRGVPAATGRAIRWRREDGFHPLRGLAAQILDIAPGAPVAPALTGLPAPLRDAVGLLLGADTGPGWRGIAPSERSRRLRDSLAGLLRWWSADGPRIAVIDDLHWADSDTLDAVAAALRELPGMPVLLLLTARHDLPLDPATRRLPLGPLTAAEAEELSRHVRPATGTDGATAPLLARAGGNPFFIEEATASLEDLPPTLRVLIGSRIDRLPADAKRLVELLAALAEPVPLPLFAACAGRAPGEAELLRGLGALDRDGLLDVSEEGGLRRVACRHALVQEVAYRGLTERRRRELHAGIAGRLEAALGAEAPRHAAALARHARLGQDWDRVVRHAAEAARQALSRFANRAAVGFMEDALTALDRLPPEPARLRQAIDLRFQLRDPLFRLGRTERLRARLAEAAPLAERLEDWERLGQLRLFESHRAWLTGDYPAAEDAAERAAVQARQKGDAALALRARFQLGLCRLGRGRLEECASLMAEVAAGAEDPAVIGRYGLDPPLVAVALNYRARALADLGDLAGARRAMEACRHQAARVDLPFTWVFAALAEGAVLLAEGEAGAAAERLSWALGQCDKAETDLMRVVVLTLLGAAARAAGRPSEAAGHLREAIGLAGGMRFLIHQPLRLALLAEALLDAGPGTEAPTLAVEALTLAEAQGDAMSHAAARRALARLAAAPARG